VRESYYGAPLRLATTSRRLDQSPAWLSFVGAAHSLALVERVGPRAIAEHNVGLANRLPARLGQPPRDTAIVTLDLHRLGYAATVDTLHPFAPLSEGETYFDSPDSVLYYGNAWGALIEEFTEKGILPDSGFVPDDIVWAADIWKQMEDYREKSSGLIEELEGADLGEDAAALLEEAKVHYEHYNFLDAYRLALAARG